MSSLEAVLAALQPPEIRDDAVTSTEVAEALGISANTALRQLKLAVADGRMRQVRTRRVFPSGPKTTVGYVTVQEMEDGESFEQGRGPGCQRDGGRGH